MGGIPVHDGGVRATTALPALTRRSPRAPRLGRRPAVQLLALCAGVAIAAIFDYAPMGSPAQMTCEEFLGLTPSERAGVVASIEGATAPGASAQAAATVRHAAGMARQCRLDGGRQLGELPAPRSDASSTTPPYTAD